MAVFNLGCIGGSVDKETGCYRQKCDTNGTFEACRQSFYLKQQNEILKQSSQQEQAVASSSNNQKIIDQQNQQIAQLIQNYEQATHKIENLNLMGVILATVLFVVAWTFIIVKLVKRRGASK